MYWFYSFLKNRGNYIHVCKHIDMHFYQNVCVHDVMNNTELSVQSSTRILELLLHMLDIQ